MKTVRPSGHQHIIITPRDACAGPSKGKLCTVRPSLALCPDSSCSGPSTLPRLLCNSLSHFQLPPAKPSCLPNSLSCSASLLSNRDVISALPVHLPMPGCGVFLCLRGGVIGGHLLAADFSLQASPFPGPWAADRLTGGSLLPRFLFVPLLLTWLQCLVITFGPDASGLDIPDTAG